LPQHRFRVATVDRGVHPGPFVNSVQMPSFPELIRFGGPDQHGGGSIGTKRDILDEQGDELRTSAERVIHTNARSRAPISPAPVPAISALHRLLLRPATCFCRWPLARIFCEKPSEPICEAIRTASEFPGSAISNNLWIRGIAATVRRLVAGARPSNPRLAFRPGR
jgi:hypothetical protein